MPRRIKACATCRQKRIKCDATMPECLMCIKFKRKCPGPIEAPLLFIDNSSFPSGKRPRKMAPVSQPRTERQELAKSKTGMDESQLLPDELSYVMLAQVSPRYMLNEAFFANLTAFFCADGRHLPGAPRKTPMWLHALPKMAIQGAGSGERSEALSLALRATAAAFTATEQGNASLLEYACRLYGNALRSQGKVLAYSSRKQLSGEGKTAGIGMFAASVMLSMFEAIVATTGQAYAEHVIGAAKILDRALSPTLLRAQDSRIDKERGIAGPRSEPGPLLTNIFFHIRIQLLYVYLTSTDERLRRDDIMDRVLVDICGWHREKLPLNQQVLTPLAQLAKLSSRAENIYEEGAKTKVTEWAEVYENVKREVEKLWKGYTESTRGQRLHWRNMQTGHTDFRDPFTALQYAYFSACWILLDVVSSTRNPNDHVPLDSFATSSPITPSSALPLRFSPPLSKALPPTATVTPPVSTTSPHTPLTPWNSASLPTEPPPGSRPPQVQEPESPTTPPKDHFTLILSVAWYLRQRDVGFSYLRLHVPLFLVARYAPRSEQRKIARFMFEEWRVGSLRGVGALAIEKLDAIG